MSRGDEVDLEILRQLKDTERIADQDDQYGLSVVATLRSMPPEQNVYPPNSLMSNCANSNCIH